MKNENNAHVMPYLILLPLRPSGSPVTQPFLNIIFLHLKIKFVKNTHISSKINTYSPYLQSFRSKYFLKVTKLKQ